MHHGDETATMAIGRPNGPRHDPFDRWFRYPAGFGALALSATLRAIGSASGVVVDPFAGVATAARPLAAAGWRFKGIEVHPAIAELAEVKLRCDIDPARLVAAATVVSRSPTAETVAAEHPTVVRSFAPDTLATLVGLREGLAAVDEAARPLLKWALLATLRDVATVKVGWPYQRPGVERRARHADARTRFLRRVEFMAEDLAATSGSLDAVVVHGDSRREDVWSRLLGKTLADACVSSPPYLNNYDYADATRLELYFWGTVRSWADLTSTVRAEMITASTQQTTVSAAEESATVIGTWGAVGRDILALRERLSRERRLRPRGKEYDNLLVMYFADIAAVLRRMACHLAEGATVAWVVGDSAPYGVYVDTPDLVSKVAAMVGFIPVSDETLRARGNRWVTNGSRHQVALTERLIVLRLPAQPSA